MKRIQTLKWRTFIALPSAEVVNFYSASKRSRAKGGALNRICLAPWTLCFVFIQRQLRFDHHAGDGVLVYRSRALVFILGVFRRGFTCIAHPSALILVFEGDSSSRDGSGVRRLEVGREVRSMVAVSSCMGRQRKLQVFSSLLLVAHGRLMGSDLCHYNKK